MDDFSHPVMVSRSSTNKKGKVWGFKGTTTESCPTSLCPWRGGDTNKEALK